MSDTDPTENHRKSADRGENAAVEYERGPSGHTEAVPGPDGLPVIDSTLAFTRDPLGFLSEIRAYGGLAAYEAFGREFVVVSDPGLVEEVLVSRSDEYWRGEFESEFGEELGIEGILFAEGENWRRQRILLQNAFTPDRIISYADTMVEETTRAVEGWDDGNVVELRETFSTLTLKVLTRSLFDLEFDGERAARVRRWVHALGRYIETDLFGVRSILPSWVPSRAETEFERATDDVEALVAELVAEREADGEGDDLLSLLTSAEYPDGSRPTAEEITDQLLIFLIAGHETTATALIYACWLLADDEDARSCLTREIDSVCGDRDPTFGDLSKLHVTEAVGREAMRLYPPLPFLNREPHEETDLGRHRIQPGTTVQLNAYGIHRDARWWDEPASFRPGRWLDEDGTLTDGDRPEYAYFPFGGGPRHCIGMRFAMTELQLSLATLAARVELERVTESLDPTLKVSLDPGRVEMRVHER